MRYKERFPYSGPQTAGRCFLSGQRDLGNQVPHNSAAWQQTGCGGNPGIAGGHTAAAGGRRVSGWAGETGFSGLNTTFRW